MDSDVLTPADFSSPEEYRLWAVTVLAVYSEAAEQNIKEAEDLIAKGIELRHAALDMLNRAEVISFGLARFLDGGSGIEK